MVLHILVRSLGIFVVVSMCYLCLSQSQSLFVWHPILMSVGSIMLLTESLIAFTSTSTAAQQTKYKYKVNAQWALNAGAALIAISFWSIYSDKNNNSKEHFASLHAKYGLAALLMVIGTTSLGNLARYSAAFQRFLRPAHLKLIHSLFGALTYSFGMYTFCLGLKSDWFRLNISVPWTSMLTYSIWLMTFLLLINIARQTISIVLVMTFINLYRAFTRVVGLNKSARFRKINQ